MNSLAEYVRKNFKGMLLFGDIHSDYTSFMKARTYAVEHGLFFHSLGDLVDRGTQPFEVVSAFAQYIAEGSAGFTIGNHDDKFYRHAAGNKVSFSRDGKATFEHVGEERKDEFLRLYVGIMNTPIFSSMFHKFDDFTIVHAASHKCMWEDDDKFDKAARARALVGETTGRIGEDGYPERLYNWIEEVPIGKTVIVGHDRMPIFDKVIEVPLIRTNANGGKVIFMDTGCGKGGFLTGAVMRHDKKFTVERFVEFK